MNKPFRAFLLTAAIVAASRAGEPEAATAPVGPTDAKGRSMAAEYVGDGYAIRVFRSLDVMPAASYRILKGDTVVAEAEGHKFLIGGLVREDDRSRRVTPGPDITGDGIPEPVISEWTGGAHSDFIVHVFASAPGPEPLARFNGLNNEPAFEDIDGDKAAELITNDWTFAYWKTSFAESPRPEVILRWRDGAFTVAPDLMAEPGLSEEVLQAVARELSKPKHRTETGIGPGVWETMLHLIYTGNRSQAYALFHAVWPTEVPGKDEFLAEFQQKLRESPYWDGIRAIGRPQPK